MTKAAVIGCGNIGLRHIKWLQELGCEVAGVSRRPADLKPIYSSITDCLKNFHPDYVVIANETSAHKNSIEELAQNNFSGKLLIEKPLFANPIIFPKHSMSHVYVAYNLRFHPILQKVKTLIQNSKKIVQVHAYVGKYVPTWRPEGRLGYSATVAQGGGVLRDLSHELDYLLWFLGQWQSVSASGGRYSQVTVDSDDAYSMLIKTKRCPLVTLAMNYLDQKSRREIIIQLDTTTIKADLISQTLEINDQTESFSVDKNFTYLKQHEAILKNDSDYLCSLNEGEEVMKLIQAAEDSANKALWIHR